MADDMAKLTKWLHMVYGKDHTVELYNSLTQTEYLLILLKASASASEQNSVQRILLPLAEVSLDAISTLRHVLKEALKEKEKEKNTMHKSVHSHRKFSSVSEASTASPSTTAVEETHR